MLPEEHCPRGNNDYAKCSLLPVPRLSTTPLMSMLMQPRETGPGIWELPDRSLHCLTSVQSSTLFTGRCLEAVRFLTPWHFLRRHFYKWGPGLGVIPFPLWFQRLRHSTGLFPWITKKAKLALWNKNKSKQTPAPPCYAFFTQFKNNMTLQCKISYICSGFMFHSLPSVAVLSWMNIW